MDVNEMAKGISLHISEQDFQYGVNAERERIIKMLEHVHDETCSGADGSAAYQAGFEHAIALIKGENKCIHEIEVFGAPCLGGDFHEYCLKCGWVEPCEIDGENK
jgi:hypothetical protein